MTENNQAGGSGQSAGGSGGASGAGDNKGAGNQEGQGLVFDTWIGGQPEEVKTLLDGHEKGLKTALEGEREARKSLEKQLKELVGKAEKGSELEKQLNELISKQATAEAQATFYEDAHAAGITNLKLAWIVAGSDGFIDSRGRVNFGDMKTKYPELFGQAKAAPKGNAGSGAGSETPGNKSMNDFIRKSAGRG